MRSTAPSPSTDESPTRRPGWDPERLAGVGALIVVVTLSVCVVIVVVAAALLASHGKFSPVAFLGLVTTLLAALTPSPLTKLRAPVNVDVDKAEQVGPNT